MFTNNQNAVTILSLAASLLLSLFAIIVSLATYNSQRKDSSYSDIDKAYNHILELGMQYPQFRAVNSIRELLSTGETDVNRVSYNSYAYMTWNILETIFDRARSDPYMRKTWFPVVIEENRLHHTWFQENQRKFKPLFQEFVMQQIHGLTVRKAGVREFSEIYRKLVRDFPAGELKNKDQFQRLVRAKVYTVYIAHSNFMNEDVGYALVFAPHSSALAWLDYLAIEPSYRNSGFGTHFVQKLKESLPDDLGIVLEVEKPVSDDAAKLLDQQRRIAFYDRLGAHKLQCEYLFPGDDPPLPMYLYFYPISVIDVLPREQLVGIIEQVFAKIHNDVPKREAILAQFIGSITDQRLISG